MHPDRKKEQSIRRQTRWIRGFQAPRSSCTLLFSLEFIFHLIKGKKKLHTLEDFSAHSNFCELTLISMGHTEVFSHVGDYVRIQAPNGKQVAPLVTGTFGSSDFTHSLLGGAGYSFLFLWLLTQIFFVCRGWWSLGTCFNYILWPPLLTKYTHIFSYPS